MKNRCKFRSGKYKPKNRSKTAFGKVLGAFWEGFGSLWGLFWALLGAFGRFLWPSKSNFYKALVQHGLQKAFWIDFGSIWEGLRGFGEGWEGFWPGLDEEFEGFAALQCMFPGSFW